MIHCGTQQHHRQREAHADARWRQQPPPGWGPWELFGGPSGTGWREPPGTKGYPGEIGAVSAAKMPFR